MKCPKCGYLGFEPVDRCRNCGYEFSLAPSLPLPELPMRQDVDLSPLEDLALVDQGGPVHADQGPADLGRAVDDGLGAPPTPAPSSELPLFLQPISDDVPLITKASPPRAPLAVRRATPETPRLRDQVRTPTLDFFPTEDRPPTGPVRSEPAPSRPGPSRHAGAIEDAGVGARLAAAAIDLTLLAIIDAAVVYFTMQICGLAVADLELLPLGPLVAFLLVQNGGYLVAFTVGGQTLGKMATGIRVVSAAPGQPVDFPHAALRELLWFLLAVPAGLGFLTAVFTTDHRGLHDRFAGTRVVRTAA